MHSLFFRSSLAVALAGATACTQLQSADITTTGISAAMTVTADVTGNATVDVQLNVDDNPTDYVTLSPGDTLTATSGSQTELLAENSDLFDEVDYTAAFENGGAEGATYTVSLRRVTGLDAPMSTCTMPAPFDVTAPTGSPSFSRAGGDVVVKYAPSGGSDPVSWSLSGQCGDEDIDDSSTALAGDPGTFTIPASALMTSAQNGTIPGNCQVTVTIDRTHAGSLDPAFADGTISGVQERTLTFTSTP